MLAYRQGGREVWDVLNLKNWVFDGLQGSSEISSRFCSMAMQFHMYLSTCCTYAIGGGVVVCGTVRAKTDLVVCFGELLIDFVPTVGGLSLADAPAFKKAPGGAPANVAVGIAKLGGNAAFIGKVSCYYSTTWIYKLSRVYWALQFCLCHALADISSMTNINVCQ